MLHALARRRSSKQEIDELRQLLDDHERKLRMREISGCLSWGGLTAGAGFQVAAVCVVDDARLSVLFALELSVDGGKAAEEHLAHIGHADGVRAGDAAADELPNDIAEEGVDVDGAGEVGDAGEDLGGEGLLIGLTVTASLGGMVSTEGRMVPGQEQVTTAAAMGHMGAGSGSGPLGSRGWKLEARGSIRAGGLRIEARGWKVLDPYPRVFCARV
jgi:hypothetical protein